MPEYFSRTNIECRQVAFPHADVTIGDTSEPEHGATYCTVVRNEKLAVLLGDLVERGVEAKYTVGGLHIFGDVTTQTEAQHVQVGVVKNSEVVHKRNGYSDVVCFETPQRRCRPSLSSHTQTPPISVSWYHAVFMPCVRLYFQHKYPAPASDRLVLRRRMQTLPTMDPD